MSEFKQPTASSKKFLANPTNDDDDCAVESGPSSNTPVRPHSSSFPDSGRNAYSDTLPSSKGVGIKRSRRPTINELRERGAIVSSFHHNLEEFTETSTQNGLIPIHSPEFVTVDIILVHHLKDQQHSCWTKHNAKKKENSFWPRDILKDKMKGARIWSLTHSLTVKSLGSNSTISPIATVANNFLVDFSSQRKEDAAENPHLSAPGLIFIGVGIGGAIIKKILLDCKESDNKFDDSIWKCNTGIIFLGTQHSPRLDTTRSFRPSDTSLQDINWQEVAAEMESINTSFQKILLAAAHTFCVANARSPRDPSRKDSWYTGDQYSIFPNRPDHNKNYYVQTDTEDLGKFVNESDPLFRTILAQMKDWESKRFKSDNGENETRGLRLLSLDGGGIRGLASLLILEAIMNEVRKVERSKDSELHRCRLPLPCDYFELVGGTSTGGLMGIMLFRLKMDIASAKNVYRLLSSEIFKPNKFRYFGINVAKVILDQPWYSSQALGNFIKSIIRDWLPLDEKTQLHYKTDDALLIPPVEEALREDCKLFLCATKKHGGQAVRLRSYQSPYQPQSRVETFENCTIAQAARASSAAPFYFRTAEIGETKFWDGGLRNNNPIEELWAEQGEVFPGKPVSCVVSIGTGKLLKEPKKLRSILGKGRTLGKMLTDTEDLHNRFQSERSTDKRGVEYFRFNPEIKSEIGLHEYEKMDILAEQTEKYIEEKQESISKCARLLVRIPEHQILLSKSRPRTLASSSPSQVQTEPALRRNVIPNPPRGIKPPSPPDVFALSVRQDTSHESNLEDIDLPTSISETMNGSSRPDPLAYVNLELIS